jgi:hypothetical protein
MVHGDGRTWKSSSPSKIVAMPSQWSEVFFKTYMEDYKTALSIRGISSELPMMIDVRQVNPIMQFNIIRCVIFVVVFGGTACGESP